MDADRRKVLPAGVRTISDSLTKAIQPILNDLENYSDINDMIESAPKKINQNEIEQGYINLYVGTMPKFAKKAFEGRKQETMDDIWVERTTRYVQQDLINRIVHVTGTTENRVRSILAKGLKEGMSIPEIAGSLDELGLPQIIRNRSTVIARTEIINASNRGTMLGLQSTRLDLKKVWITAIDGRERAEHAAADGQEVDLNRNFRVGGEELEYPGDPAGSAWNTIQCRCSIAGVT